MPTDIISTAKHPASWKISNREEERLQAETDAIGTNIRQTEEILYTRSGTMAWERVMEMKARLHDLGFARKQRLKELRRLTEQIPGQTEKL